MKLNMQEKVGDLISCDGAFFFKVPCTVALKHGLKIIFQLAQCESLYKFGQFIEVQLN